MKKINKNSYSVLYTEHDSYLFQKPPDNFILNGETPFTIEAFFTIDTSITGILYGQENGFSFGLNNGLLYFKLDGFILLTVPQDFRLKDTDYYFAAVVYNGTEISLFIDGIKLITEEKIANVDSVSGDYTIGKFYHGYIHTVRLYSIALSDERILSDSQNMPETVADCEFCADFSTVQYKDISGNNLALWRIGNTAECTEITPCCKLEGTGCYKKTNSFTVSNNYTLLGKFFPDLSAKRTGYLYSVGTVDKHLFSIKIVQKKDDRNSFLSIVSDDGTKLIGTEPIAPLEWCDFAVTLSEGTATLYMDGTEVTTGDFAFSTDKQLFATIGVKYFTSGRPAFDENAYFGYIDFFAEFNKTLTSEEIDAYAENPPYLFEKDIQSLSVFGWGEPVELVGIIPISSIGDTRFVFVQGTNPHDAPKGLSLNIPTTVDPAYEALSKDEKWAYETTEEYLKSFYKSIFGMIPKDGELPLHQTATTVFERTFNETIRCITYNPPSGAAMRSPLKDTSWVSSMICAIIEIPAVRTVLVKSFNFVKKYKTALITGAVLIGGVTIAAIVTSLTNDLEDKEEDREPPEENNVKLISLCLNHNGNNTTGSIHFHTGKNQNKPDSMVYSEINGRFDVDAVIVKKDLSGEAYIEAMISCVSTSGKQIAGTLKMEDSAKIIDDASVTFSCPSGITIPVRLPLIFNTTINDKKEVISLSFRCNEAKISFIANATITVYNISELPVSPWNNYRNTLYDKTKKEYVSTKLIEFGYANPNTNIETQHASNSLRYTNEEVGIIDNVMAMLNSNTYGFTYHYVYDENDNLTGGGASFYTDNGGNFKVLKFLLDSDPLAVAPYHPLNCTDCATIISSIAAAFGIVCPMAILTGMNGGFGFRCNQIQAITNGNEVWAFPFQRPYGNGVLGGAFSYHQVNVTNDEIGVNKDSGIFDACLKIDVGQYPSSNANLKQPIQPSNIPAAGTNNMRVSVTEPYNEPYYRERLVLNGQNASYLIHSLSVPGFSFAQEIPIAHSARQPLVDLIKQAYDIKEEYYQATPTMFADLKLINIEGIANYEMNRENLMEEDHQFLFHGKPYSITRHVCKGNWLPGQLIATVLSYINCVATKIEDREGLGKIYEAIFSFGSNMFVALKKGQVLVIRGVEASKLADIIGNSL